MSRDLVWVAFSLMIWGLGEGMFFIFQPLYLQQFGADPLTIGTILGVMGFSMAVAQVPAGYLADRVGSRPLMWAAWLIALLATGIMALAQSLWVFVAGLILYNLTAFVSTPMSSYVADMRGRWKVSRALTLTQAMYNLGAVAGPVLGGWIGQQLGLRSVYQFSFWVFVLSLLLIFLIRPQPRLEHTHSAPVVKLHQSPQFLILLFFFFLTTFSAYLPQPLTPNYLQNQQGLDLAQIGQLGSIGSIGVVVLMLALGNLSPLIGLLAGQTAMALYALLLWRGTGFGWFALAYSCVGGYRLARAMILAYARPVVPQRQISFAFGMIELVNGLALFLAPPVGAWLYAQSPAALYSVGLFGVIAVALINLAFLPAARRAFEASQIQAIPMEEPK